MTSLRRLLPPSVRARVRRGSDEGIALMTTLMAIVLVGLLSMLVLGMILAQRVPTMFLEESSKTVFAAEAGVNAAIGQIRTAEGPMDANNKIYGDRTKLPCRTQGPVEGAGGTLTYDAVVRYYLHDPAGKDEAWLAANALACTPGAGPVSDPSYAVVTSTGSGTGVPGTTADGSRTVQVVYEFQVTNNNIPGGLIYSFDKDQPVDRFCLEAESATVNAYVKYVPAVDCGTDDIHQLWIYDTDYRIKLASTTLESLGFPDPLCITGPNGAAMPQKVTLQVCKHPTDPARWNQLFSWEGGAKWRGQENPISSGYANVWLYSGSTSGAPGGRYLHVGTTGASDAEWGSFNPDARVGAGAAGKNTNQIVNYLEFGRCTDVTDEDVNKSFMIVYPCKQDPIPGQPNLLWNHKWYYEEPVGELGSKGPQQIYVMRNGTKYCLRSAGTENGYVTLTSSCSATAANQKWTRHAETGAYSSSWTFVDNWGRCLSLGDKYNGAWSKITTASCNGGLGQKWNAPPHTVSASLDGYKEIP